MTVATMGVRRSNQVYFEQVSTRTTLDCGYAYLCDAHRRAPQLNFMGEIELGEDAAGAPTLIDAFFREHDAECGAWRPRLEQPPEPLEPLAAQRGLARCESVSLVLPLERRISAVERIRCLSARAMRRTYTQVLTRRAELAGAWGAAWQYAMLERLNDPQYEALLALRGDQPLGIAALLQVGQIGRLCDFFVLPEQRRMGVGTALAAQLVATARRWRLLPVCLEIDTQNLPARAWAQRLGFVDDGVMVWFVRPDARESWT